MFEPTFIEVFYAVFSANWCDRAPAVLSRSPRQIRRWLAGESRPPRRALVLLERYATEKAMSQLQARRVAGHQAVEQEYDLRRNQISGAVTSLRILLNRVDREPKPHIGRPKKRRPALLWLVKPRPARVPH